MKNACEVVPSHGTLQLFFHFSQGRKTKQNWGEKKVGKTEEEKKKLLLDPEIIPEERLIRNVVRLAGKRSFRVYLKCPMGDDTSGERMDSTVSTQGGLGVAVE